jgi:hypothetical protein
MILINNSNEKVKIMMRKLFIISIINLLALIFSSISVAADGGGQSCFGEGATGFSLLEILSIAGGILALIFIVYILIDRGILKKKSG